MSGCLLPRRASGTEEEGGGAEQ
uniref:Uncharacterized protein n=1 Tax=Arundo donax TaxID=35708 RepID=A0A0A9C1G5_ARUDO